EIGSNIDHGHTGLEETREELRQPDFPISVEHEVTRKSEIVGREKNLRPSKNTGEDKLVPEIGRLYSRLDGALCRLARHSGQSCEIQVVQPHCAKPPDMRSTAATLSPNVKTAVREFWLRKPGYASEEVDRRATKLKPLLPDADHAPCGWL